MIPVHLYVIYYKLISFASNLYYPYWLQFSNKHTFPEKHLPIIIIQHSCYNTFYTFYNTFLLNRKVALIPTGRVLFPLQFTLALTIIEPIPFEEFIV